MRVRHRILAFDLWRLCRLRVEAPAGAAHQRGQQVRRSDVDGTQPSVSLGQFPLDFFLHIAIRVGWLGLLPPLRLLRRGLVGLWLVAAVAHFNCTYDFFFSR